MFQLEVRVLIVTILVFCASPVISQIKGRQCAHSPNGLFETIPSFENWLRDIARLEKKSSRERRQNRSYQIRVVVHVIHNGESVGVGVNISDEQIRSQLLVLNNDFNRRNPDAVFTPPEFETVAGSMDIEFRLAEIDPSGNSTSGIVRVKGTKNSWTIAEHEMIKSQSYWPAENFLNIWVCNIEDDFFGLSQFPVSTLPGIGNSPRSRLTDGILISHRVFGSSDHGDFDLEERYDKGRGLTHEMGHFLGLRHLWGDVDGCSGNDHVEDTPRQSGPTYSCAAHPFPDCSSNRMFQNFLDFTDDACMNLFTRGQIERMRIVLENSPRRASLLLPLENSADTFEYEKIFSPNGDGVNDYWRWNNTLAYDGCSLKVFNRFGKVVYESVAYDNSWDGRDREGNALEAEAYYFILRCDGKADVTGGVRIVR